MTAHKLMRTRKLRTNLKPFYAAMMLIIVSGVSGIYPSGHANAADVYWDGVDTSSGNGAPIGGTGTWDKTTTNWTDDNAGTNNQAWMAGDDAIFGETGGTVTLGVDQTVRDITFSEFYNLIGPGEINLASANNTFRVNTYIPPNQLDPEAEPYRVTIGNAINGAGGITKTGGGDLTLGGILDFSDVIPVLTVGSLNYTGTTTISAGHLTLLDMPDSNIINNASLTLGVPPTGDMSYSHTISGTGDLTIQSAGLGTDGNLTLSGVNTYTGNTALIGRRSTVSISSDQNLGNASGSLRLSLGLTLRTTADLTTSRNTQVGWAIFHTDESTTFTHNGVITGNADEIQKLGEGKLVLGGANTFTTNFYISAGTLSISADNNLGIDTFVSMHGDSTLETTGSFSSNKFISIGGTNTIDVSAGTTFTHDGEYRGGSSGELTKSGAGTLILTDAKFNSADTIVAAGILALQGGDALSDTGTVNVSGGILEILDAETIGALSGSGIVSLGASITSNGATDTTFSGSLKGAGGLTKTGTGSLTLSTSNTFSGDIVLKEGTLKVSADNQLGSANNKLKFDGGALQNTASFSTGRSTTLNSDGGTFYTDAGTTLTHSAVISGNGSLTKSGAGTLMLTGFNTYNDDTVINAGVVAISNSSALGTGGIDVGGGELLAAQSCFPCSLSPSVFNGTGLSSTFSAGSGQVLIFSPVNVHIGNNHSMNIGSAGNDSLVVLSPSGSVTQGFSPPGSLAVNFGTLLAGNTLLSNLTDGLASTTIAAGAELAFDDNFSSQNSIKNLQGSGTLSTGTSAATDIRIQGGSFSGVIKGDGKISKISSGTLALSGANTYGGGTTVSGGTLQGTTSSLQGNIVNNANVTFDQTTTETYAGIISGTGSLTKSDTGTVTLSGANTYSGMTTIDAGKLEVSGSIASTTIVVNSGGTFQVNEGSVVDVAAVQLNSNSDLALTGGVLEAQNIELFASASFQFTGGILRFDSYQGNLLNQSGALKTYQDSAITGDYTQNAAGQFEVDMLGTGSHGKLTVSATANLAGTLKGTGDSLDINAISIGTSFDILAAEQIIGNFQTIDLPPLPSDRLWQSEILIDADGSTDIYRLTVVLEFPIEELIYSSGFEQILQSE